jgi:dihydroorotate dehydrogenase (fumarate)
MTNLSTTYMGLQLKNPIIVGACNLTLDLDVARKLEDAGASAIVFKSLFEEQIGLERLQMEEDLREYEERNAEMVSLFPHLKHAGPLDHLEKLSKLKKSLSIPVIGSLNCYNHQTWLDYATEMEKTGIDALELNFYANPREIGIHPNAIEAEQISLVREIKARVKIPISVKVSQFYSNPLHHIAQLVEAGAKGVVVFNRLFHPDIDPESQQHVFPFNLSQVGDYRLPLRYTGLLYKNIQADICSNTGIFHGEDVVKMILAGAAATQIVSTLYKNKVAHLNTMLEEVSQWMERKSYTSIADFKGKLSHAHTSDPFAFNRAQYVDLMMKPLEVLKKYPQV